MRRFLLLGSFLIFLGVVILVRTEKVASPSEEIVRLTSEIPTVPETTGETLPAVKGEESPLASPDSELDSRSSRLKEFLVTKVIDGDTIVVEGGERERVRYIGMDTPEIAQGNNCFAKEVADKNRELVEGKIVRLEKDASERDRYQRLLRYVWVGGIFVNDYLVREGYATAVSYPPDVKYQEQFIEAEKEARKNNRGLWGKMYILLR